MENNIYCKQLNEKKQKHLIHILLVLSILGLLFVHFYAPRFITEIRNPVIELYRGNNLITYLPSFENNQLNGKYITFNSFDGVQLTGFLTYSNIDSVKGTIILLHGIRSNKECFIELSQKLSHLGYNSVALDSRAHGQSGGIHCTFGVKEKKDVSELITLLGKQEMITDNIGIWGQSLGGAIGLQTMAIDNRIKFGIIESTFTDFETITNDYFKYNLGFNFLPLTKYLVYRAGKIAEFDPKDARPIKYCKDISQPIIIVHGNKDQRIDIKYAKDNFTAIGSLKKEFIEVDNAHHLNVWKIGGESYFDRIMEFVSMNTMNTENSN